MKRLLVLFLLLFTLTTVLFAFPLYPQQTVVKYQLANGHKLELDFFAPKDSLQYFDSSLLTDGFAQLAKIYTLTNDFSVSFAPQNTGELLFLVSFDGLSSGLSSSLHPTTNAEGLRGLPLDAPRDALAVVLAWYKSFLTNPSPDKSVSFISSMRKTVFTVNYSAMGPGTGHGLQLAMHGSFQSDTPVFDSKMEVMDFSTFINSHITIADDSYVQALQNDYFYILDPISDPNTPGVKRESVMVYALFDKVAPK